MFYFACAIVFVWLGVALFLYGRQMNLLRLTLNNLAPGANYWGPEYEAFRQGYAFSRIKPELFNADGQKYLKKLGQNGLFLGIWMVVAFLLAIWLSPYFMAS